MPVLQAGDISIGEIDAKGRAAQVRTRLASFRELADVVRGADTGVILETMEAYAASNAEGEVAAVDLAVRGVLR